MPYAAGGSIKLKLSKMLIGASALCWAILWSVRMS